MPRPILHTQDLSTEVPLHDTRNSAGAGSSPSVPGRRTCCWYELESPCEECCAESPEDAQSAATEPVGLFQGHEGHSLSDPCATCPGIRWSRVGSLPGQPHRGLGEDPEASSAVCHGSSQSLWQRDRHAYRARVEDTPRTSSNVATEHVLQIHQRTRNLRPSGRCGDAAGPDARQSPPTVYNPTIPKWHI